MTLRISNDLGLEPPKRNAAPVTDPVPVAATTVQSPPSPSRLQTEFAFELPTGYLDADGNLHRKGVMRLSKAIDEITPMRDPRVKSNPAYATVIILSRVITQLGALDEVTPTIVEGLFASDLNYLQQFYRQINKLDMTVASPSAGT